MVPGYFRMCGDEGWEPDVYVSRFTRGSVVLGDVGVTTKERLGTALDTRNRGSGRHAGQDFARKPLKVRGVHSTRGSGRIFIQGSKCILGIIINIGT